jgi:peptide/nickel transport system permease protein
MIRGDSVAESREKKEGRIIRFFRALKREKLPWFALLIIIFVLFAAILAPILTPHSPTDTNLPNRMIVPVWQEEGQAGYFLGTDTLGRDLVTRILFGGRVSLLVVLLVLVAGGGGGLILGILAAYSKPIIGDIIMRIADAIMSIPSLLLALVFSITLGASITTIVLALSFVLWARVARLVRGEVLKIKNQDYVLLAKVSGCSSFRIMVFHIMPNVFNTFLVMLSLQVGWVILTEATLSFLGAGIPPPTASWGQMISEGRGYITSAWWISFFPGLVLALTVLAFNLLGDWLRDRLDPKLRQL